MDIDRYYKENKQRHVAMIRRALKFNKDLSEDIVQDAYIKAMQYQDSYDPKLGSYNSWFNGILFNCLKKTQEEFKYQTPLNEQMVIEPESIEFLIIMDQEIKEIKNTKHRSIVDLFYRCGYNSHEISSMLGITVTNITTICNRFRNRVKQKYGILI